MSAHVELDAINAEIATLEAKHDAVKGTETEVYSRIVGYLGNIRRHQPGKIQEIKERLMFDIPLAMSNIEKRGINK